MKNLFLMGLVVLLAGVGLPAGASAQTPPSDFYLQVSPSPLVTTVKPGQVKNVELNIKNAGTGTEELKIEPRRFSVDKTTGKVKLDDTTPSEISQWIKYSAPTFTIQSGKTFTEKIRIALPKQSGFSYSLAFVISRTKTPQATESSRVIKGSVAVFTLINVDRPGAIRKVEVEKFSTSADIYEYLPSTIDVLFKNTGNTFVQPYGNIFIQRGSDDKDPIATLPVNEKQGYILPGNERTLSTDWSDGFPSFKTTIAADGSQQRSEVWDWSKLSKFRIGRYTAKLVAVYNDGQHDIPIEREVTFWVLPWKIILAALFVVALVVLGVWTILRKVWKLLRRGKKKSPKSETKTGE